jgi:hypothetical protein
MKALIGAACAVLVAGLCRPAWAGQEAPPVSGAGAARTAPMQARPAPQPPPKAKPQPVKPAPLTAAQLAKRAPGRPGSFEILAGAAWLGPGSIGSSSANLTANGSTTPYRYFVASGDMRAAPAFDARVAYNLTRRFTVEGGVNYSAPSVQVSIGSDAEGAAAATAPSEKLSQYFVDASLLVFMPKLSFARGRGRMFVEGGAGYHRQLHEGNFNVEAGQVYNAGGGVKYYFTPRPRGFVKGFGVRMDLRGYYKNGGYTFDGANSWTVSLGGGAVVAF